MRKNKTALEKSKIKSPEMDNIVIRLKSQCINQVAH